MNHENHKHSSFHWTEIGELQIEPEKGIGQLSGDSDHSFRLNSLQVSLLSILSSGKIYDVEGLQKRYNDDISTNNLLVQATEVSVELDGITRHGADSKLHNYVSQQKIHVALDDLQKKLPDTLVITESACQLQTSEISASNLKNILMVVATSDHSTKNLQAYDEIAQRLRKVDANFSGILGLDGKYVNGEVFNYEFKQVPETKIPSITNSDQSTVSNIPKTACDESPQEKSSDVAEPKKRRSRKKDVATEPAEVAPVVPKKRGRPKKVVPPSTEVTTEPKKRRSRKKDVATEPVEVIPVVPKKRGRPKKVVASIY